MKKWIITIFLLVLVIFSTKVNAKEENYKVHFIDTEQSDCILLEGKEGNYLIDTGLPYTYDKVLKYLSNKDIKALEGIIITHYHDDHYGGLKNIINEISVKNIFLPAHQPLYRDYLFSYLKNNTVKISYIDKTFKLENSHLNLKILLPKEENLEIENNNGIVLTGTIDKLRYAFMADVEKEREKEIVESKEITSCDIIKVPHHGLGTSSTEKFIQTIMPKVAVITCNGLDSPSTAVVDKYAKAGAAVFRTDTHGNITIKVNEADNCIEIICNKMIK